MGGIADLDLRRKIAERLGFVNVQQDRYGQLYARQPTGETCSIPAYESDIAAAWELLVELRESDCDVSISSCGSAWCVQHLLHYHDMAEHPATAICLAYLAWKEAAPDA